MTEIEIKTRTLYEYIIAGLLIGCIVVIFGLILGLWYF